MTGRRVSRTWAGGKTGDISAAANWGGTAPAAGDTLVFPSAVTLTGSFDWLGGEGRLVIGPRKGTLVILK